MATTKRAARVARKSVKKTSKAKAAPAIKITQTEGTAAVGEYNGTPTLSLYRNEDHESDRYPFTFGLGKAIKILQNLDAIQAFVAENHEAAVKILTR